MTIFIPDAGMIPSQDVEVCCENCGAIYRLMKLDENEKKRLFQCTEHKHDQEQMQAVEFVENLIKSFPNTRNQLVRGKVDERCQQLDMATLRLNAARNTALDHDAYRAHVRRLEERVESLRVEISQIDSRRENASEAEEEEVCRLLRENPQIFGWLHGVFSLERVKEQLRERISTSNVVDDSLPCRECSIGWVYITRSCYDLIYFGSPG